MFIEDPTDAAIRLREELRRRLVHGIRGWLREKRAPRLTVAWMLTVCLLLGCALVFLLRSLDLGNSVTRAVMAILFTWPVFLGLLRWRAGVEFEQLDLDSGLGQFVRRDEAVETSRLHAFLDPQSQRSEVRQAFVDSFYRESAKQPPVALVLILVTCGTWLVWDLVCAGPTLLTDTMIDARLVTAHPSLLRKIPSGNWLNDAAAATAVHFGGIAIIAPLLMVVWAVCRVAHR